MTFRNAKQMPIRPRSDWLAKALPTIRQSGLTACEAIYSYLAILQCLGCSQTYMQSIRQLVDVLAATWLGHTPRFCSSRLCAGGPTLRSRYLEIDRRYRQTDCGVVIRSASPTGIANTQHGIAKEFWVSEKPTASDSREKEAPERVLSGAGAREFDLLQGQTVQNPVSQQALLPPGGAPGQP